MPLIDTSAWIEFLRKTGSETNIGDELLPKVLFKSASKKNPSLPMVPFEVNMFVIPPGRQQSDHQNLKLVQTPGSITKPL
jgi:hypothetical protein